MNKITKYVLLTEKDHDTLSDTVQIFIKNDWQPFGNPYQSIIGIDIYIECQAMVRYEVKE